jgi:hypothetical protein
MTILPQTPSLFYGTMVLYLYCISTLLIPNIFLGLLCIFNFCHSPSLFFFLSAYPLLLYDHLYLFFYSSIIYMYTPCQSPFFFTLSRSNLLISHIFSLHSLHPSSSHSPFLFLYSLHMLFFSCTISFLCSICVATYSYSTSLFFYLFSAYVLLLISYVLLFVLPAYLLRTLAVYTLCPFCIS